MKIQEAFMERNDIRKKIERVNSELNSVLITEEDQPLEFSAEEKLKEINDLQEKLMKLNIAIDKANSVNIEKLHRIRFLDAQITIFSNIRSILLGWKKISTRGWSEQQIVTMIKHLNTKEISDKLENLEKERRELDRALQRSNWEVDVVL